jgi:hypothetical protein
VAAQAADILSVEFTYFLHVDIVMVMPVVVTVTLPKIRAAHPQHTAVDLAEVAEPMITPAKWVEVAEVD